MDKKTILTIPPFIPKYDSNRKYGYKGKKGKDLEKLLYETSHGYCMYCYSKIDIDSKRIGHLEHSIEKKHITKLKECTPNIGLACPKCNLSFKKIGDNIDIFTNLQKEKFQKHICNQEKCNNECKEYRELKKTYLKKRNIILQPLGLEINKKQYLIQYNLLKLEFEPSSEIDYSEEEKIFIKNHIDKFNLNDSEYRTKELLKFCEDIINGDVYLRRKKYNNYIVDIFMDKIEEMDKSKRLKLCELIYKIGKMKRII